MNKLLLAGLSCVSITLATQALALNPQPEPPGRAKAIVAHPVGAAAAAAHGGTATDADDTYCGTPVPGHPHVGTAHAIIIEGKTHCNAHTIGSATGGAGAGRTNNIGSATSGAGSGR